MQSKKYLIIIAGPTASGKTTLGIELAKHYNTEIISADSRQLYKEMSIGTAKPDNQELSEVKHHLIDSLSIHQDYSVGEFEREVITLLDELFKSKDVVILAGGSGLFIKAVCEGLDTFPEIPKNIRTDLIKIFEEKGIHVLQEELKILDPDYYDQVDLDNAQRLIRALEVCRASGKSFSSFRKKEKTKRSFTPIYVSLHWDRKQLYDRINKRVDLMMEKGLLEEVINLYPFKSLNALQTVGYKELFDFLENKCTLEESINLIKQNSRRYAKRQMTWLRRDPFWLNFSLNEKKDIFCYLNLVQHSNINIRKIVTGDNLVLQTFCEEEHFDFDKDQRNLYLRFAAFKNEQIIGFISLIKEKRVNIIQTFLPRKDKENKTIYALLLQQIKKHCSDLEILYV